MIKAMRLSWVVILAAFAHLAHAQDVRRDEEARVALAKAEFQKAFDTVRALQQDLHKSGRELSAANAYRGAIAAERLAKAEDAERFLALAIAADKSLSFATSQDRVSGLKQRIAERLGRPFQPGQGAEQAVSQPTPPAADVPPAPSAMTLLQQQLEGLQQETQTLRAGAARADQDLVKAKQDLVVAQQGTETWKDRVVWIAITCALLGVLLAGTLMVQFVLVGRFALYREKARLEARQAEHAAEAAPKAFRDLIARIEEDVTLAARLLRPAHANSGLFQALVIALPQIQRYLASKRHDGAKFVTEPELPPDVPLEKVTVALAARSMISDTAKAA